jgi:uncharacterized protein (UPF0332 family)
MSLQNLAKIGQLHPHEARQDEVARLLTAAQRNLNDARRAENSAETRFDCAYKAIMQCALIALMAAGYRPATNAPGHHQTMIQSLPLTLQVDNATWIDLDGFRKKRNQNDYLGVAISVEEAEEAIAHAKDLLNAVRSHLQANHPRLLG